MLRTIINPDHISSVRIVPRLRCSHYQYKERRFFGLIKKGFYFLSPVFGETIVSESDLLDTGIYLISNKTVYYKPCIMYTMSSGAEYRRYFETFEQLHAWFKKELSEKLKLPI